MTNSLGKPIYSAVPSFYQIKAALFGKRHKTWSKRSSEYTKAVPQAYSQEEIKAARDDTLKVCFKKYVVLEMNAALKRKRIEDRKVKLPEIVRSVETCKADILSLEETEKNLNEEFGRLNTKLGADGQANLEEQLAPLVGRTYLRRFSDRIISLLRLNKKVLLLEKIKKIEEEMQKVAKELDTAKELHSLTVQIFESECSKQLTDKEEFFGLWSKESQCQVVKGFAKEIVELENGIVCHLAQIVEEDENEDALGDDSKFQKQWNKAWGELLKARKISDGGKLVLENLRDKRWGIICDRARIESKKNRKSKLQVELNSISTKGEIYNKKLITAQNIRDRYKVDYNEASKRHKELEGDASDALKNLDDQMGVYESHGNSSHIARSEKLKAKLAEEEKNAAAVLKGKKTEVAMAVDAAATAKSDMSTKLNSLKDANEDVVDLNGPSKYMSERMKNLIDDIKSIDNDIDVLRRKVEKEQAKIMVEQQKYILEARGETVPDGWKADDWSRNGYR